jgi:general secretion pathway protein E
MITHIKQVALQSGCSDPAVLDVVLRDLQPGGRSAIRVLLDAQLVDEDAFLRQLGGRFGISVWEGFGNLNPEHIRRLRKLFPAESARKRGIVPVHLQGESADGRPTVVLASTDPFDLQTHSLASRECDLPFTWLIANQQTVRDGIHALYGVGDDSLDELIESRLNADNLDDWEQTMVLDSEEGSASLTSLVNDIIRGALEQQSTDIHLDPLGPDLRIRYRIDGKLKDVPTPENMGSLKNSVISRIKIMANLDIAERRLPQDGRIHLELNGSSIDVRVATIPSVEGETVSLRLLGQETFTLNKVGMDPHMMATVKNLLTMPNGIILVTGPTGSGKSTSLYAFLSEINNPDTRIVTIEDPVENRLPGVVQIAVKNDIGLTFATGLRSILRGDPNVIMIGEMRDLETSEIAIRAALTGHLVFSTLHTNDAISGVTRLIDMGIEPFLVASSVRAFIAQRLVRKLCKNCKEPYRLHSSILSSHGWEFPDDAEKEPILHRASGCQHCRGTGYRGRIAIYELVVITGAMEELIARRAHSKELLQQALLDGFLPMRTYGIRKAIEGETSLDEVLSVTITPSQANESALHANERALASVAR